MVVVRKNTLELVELMTMMMIMMVVVVMLMIMKMMNLGAGRATSGVVLTKTGAGFFGSGGVAVWIILFEDLFDFLTKISLSFHFFFFCER